MSMIRRVLPPALGAAIAVAVWAGSAQAQLSNTAADASYGDFVACNGRVGFRTSEQLQNQSLLNGDLDFGDNVFRVLTLASGLIVNVGIDGTGPLTCGGHLFAFGVSEFNQGADLNGDGDVFDTVLHVYDASAATLTNTGLAVAAVRASASLVAFSVPEALQGPFGTDLNGDGDKGDNVLHVYDPGTLLSTNVGRDASGGIAVAGTRVAFLTSEANEFGVSKNGDTDALDTVLQTYDAVSLTLTNVGRAAEPGFLFDGNAVVFLVNESKEGNTSLNPDPDATDNVVHTYCFPGAPCANSGLTNLQFAADAFDFSGDLVAMGVREKRQNGSDLNVDGDSGDVVIFVHHLSTGATTNTHKAAYRGIGKISGNFVAFGIPERSQSRTDLNGDGDIRDLVVNVFDASTNTNTNTGRAVYRVCRNSATPAFLGCFAVRGDNLFLFTPESAQNHTDLTGDGDTKDRVLELWRLSTATLTSSGKSASVKGGMALGNSIAAVRRSEREEHLDLNGDGDLRDYVLGIYDTSTLTFLTRDSAEPLFLVEGDTAVIRTREGAEAIDFDGDGDFDDGILQYEAF